MVFNATFNTGLLQNLLYIKQYCIIFYQIFHQTGEY